MPCPQRLPDNSVLVVEAYRGRPRTEPRRLPVPTGAVLLIAMLLGWGGLAGADSLQAMIPAGREGVPPAGASPPLWPLEREPHAITGTFMEPRAAHYHSGLDIKTGGRSGLRLKAPVDGWIRRLRTSPEGYGKAIYLETADGTTLVFAHLQSFADSLQSVVTRAWARTGRYEQDLTLPRRRLTVHRGQLLGLTGASGTGAPHLHLEVRTPDERPHNPLLAGFPVPDHERPQIEGVRLVPRDGRARVEGRPWGVQLPLRQGGRGKPNTVELGDVRACGLLGVQIQTVDHTGIYAHPLMPLGVELSMDGKRCYRLEQRVFAFSQAGQMGLEIAGDGSHPGQRWLRLYRLSDNTLPDRDERVPG